MTKTVRSKAWLAGVVLAAPRMRKPRFALIVHHTDAARRGAGESLDGRKHEERLEDHLPIREEVITGKADPGANPSRIHAARISKASPGLGYAACAS
jgi:hypothetical protein